MIRISIFGFRRCFIAARWVAGMVLLTPVLVHGQSPTDSLFKAGVAAYEEQSYRQAIEAWQQVLDVPHQSAAVHYNLGNAYFRLGAFPLAVLHYERARRYAPGDEDLLHNLDLVRKKLPDRFEVPPPAPWRRLVETITRLAGAGGWSRGALVTIWLSLAATGMALFTRLLFLRKIGTWLAAVTFLLSLFCIGLAHNRWQDLRHTDAAVLMEDRIQVRSTPAEDGTEIFLLHGGVKVRVEREVRQWVRIRLPDERVGWIPRSALTMI